MNPRTLGSPGLQVNGSPATLTTDPDRSTAKRVFLTGTADGAQGRTVLLTAELCSSRLQNDREGMVNLTGAAQASV